MKNIINKIVSISLSVSFLSTNMGYCLSSNNKKKDTGSNAQSLLSVYKNAQTILFDVLNGMGKSSFPNTIKNNPPTLNETLDKQSEKGSYSLDKQQRLAIRLGGT